MGFVLGVLVIGALLSMIFGKHIGAMFVLETGTIIAICFGILLILLSPLIWFYFTSPSPVQRADGGSSSPSYGASYSAPALGTGYSPVASSAAPVNQTPVASSAGAASSQVTASPSGPTIGVTTQAADPRLAGYFAMSPGYGATVVSVEPGGPAAQAGLVSGDFIQAMDSDPITASHTLADYAAAKGVGQTIRLSVQHNDGSQWAHEWVKVTPQ